MINRRVKWLSLFLVSSASSIPVLFFLLPLAPPIGERPRGEKDLVYPDDQNAPTATCMGLANGTRSHLAKGGQRVRLIETIRFPFVLTGSWKASTTQALVQLEWRNGVLRRNALVDTADQID